MPLTSAVAMKSSDLNSLLKNLSTGEEFKKSIEDEVLSYSKLMMKTGSTIPLLFEEDEDIILDSKAVKKLLLEVIQGELTAIDLAYICDCLSLGEKLTFSNEKVQDISAAVGVLHQQPYSWCRSHFASGAGLRKRPTPDLDHFLG